MASETLRIAVFGSIDTGKSSLINALVGKEVARVSAVGGTTTAASEHRLESHEYVVHSADLDLAVIDTPGIAEVGGAERAAAAVIAARSADLVVFVVAADMTNLEHASMEALRDLGKPVVVALNKVDQLTLRQRAETVAALHARLAHTIGAENILPISAAPLTHLVVVDPATGAEELVERSGLPDVAALKERVLAIVNAEGRALKQLSSFVATLEQQRLDAKTRRETADRKVEDFAVGTALVVALNPVPLLDLAGSAVSLGLLLSQLGTVYGSSLTKAEIESVTAEIWRNARAQLAGVIALAVGGSLIKSVPFIGTVGGALMQAGAAGYMVTIAGKACIAYLENGRSWGGRNPGAVLDEIIRSVDRASVTARIVDRVKVQLKK